MAVAKVILNGTTLIDTTDKTVTSSNLLQSYTALGADGNTVTGAFGLGNITVNAGNLLSQNTTFDTPNLVLYENNSFSKSQSVSTTSSYSTWFDSFIPINLNEKIHLYINLSLSCSDIDETITVDCDYTVNSSPYYFSFTSSSQSSNIKSFSVYYTSNYLRFGFAKNNGNSETVQITGQIVVTKVVDGINTINLNLFDDPQYLNIYKSLAYRSTISASAQGVSEWINSLSSVTHQQFAGQPFTGSFVFNNVEAINTYGFGSVYTNVDGGTVGGWNGSFPSCSLISNGAFAYNRGIIGVNFPSCTTIETYAFYRCDLKTINFPLCTTIGSSAFQICRNLSNISFPSCTTIGGSAFSGCGSLKTINFPLCTTIGSYAFWNCRTLSNISFPICTTIGTSAFGNCSSLTTVNFPSCTTIGGSAFYNCSRLTNISFPSCTTIGSSAFYSCYSLTNISFPSCTTIEAYAFQHCSSLTTVNFPSCTTIGGSAFQNCNSLITVNFPLCTTIGSNAFYSCYSLTNISFPSCTTISNYAFYKCSNLSQAYFMGSSIVSIGTNVFVFTPMTDSSYLGYYGSIYVPSSLLASYQTATNWAQYSSRMVGI